jgi:hypothetical protein
VWLIRAERNGDPPIEEHVERQGTAWRSARRLFAAGYEITGIQYSIDDPPQPLGVYRFDGIRFVKLPKVKI